MTVETPARVAAASPTPPAPTPPRLPAGLSRVVVLAGRGCSESQAAWLATHLTAPPGGVELWAVAVLSQPDERAAEAALQRAGTALGRLGAQVTRRTLAGDLRVSLDAMGEVPVALPVLLDDPAGPLARWGLRQAAGPALIVPRQAPAGPPRVMVLASDAAEVGPLLAWTALWARPGVSVELIGAVPGLETRNGAAAFRQVSHLEAALEQAARRLRAVGAQVEARLAAAPGPLTGPLLGGTLLVRPAPRGWLRRWWPSQAERDLQRERSVPVLTVPCPARS